MPPSGEVLCNRAPCLLRHPRNSHQVEDCSQYLDFCRTVVSERMKTRRAQTCSDVSAAEKVGQGIAGIMTQFLKKRLGSHPSRAETVDKSYGPSFDSCANSVVPHTEETSVHRLVPVGMSVPGLGCASEKYCFVPLQQHQQWLPLHETQLPHSQQFLLSAAAGHVRVSPQQMAAVVYHLESVVLMPAVDMTNLIASTISRTMTTAQSTTHPPNSATNPLS